MWNNLKNVRSTMEKIGDAIATPGQYEEDDESYYEEEDEEGYEDEEDYYEEEEGEHTAKSPFGIVGMLTRALDQEQTDYDESHGEDADGNEQEQMHFATDRNTLDISKKIFASPFLKKAAAVIAPMPEQNYHEQADADNLTGEVSMDEQALVEEEPTMQDQPPVDDWDEVDYTQNHQSPLPRKEIAQEDEAPPPPVESPESDRPSLDDEAEATAVKSPAITQLPSFTPPTSWDEHKAPTNTRRASQFVVSSPNNTAMAAGPRLSLVRERGSVSPAQHSRSRQIFTEREASFNLENHEELETPTLHFSSSNMAARMETNKNHDPVVELMHDSSGEEEGKTRRIAPSSPAAETDSLPTVPTLQKDDLLGYPNAMPSVPALASNKRIEKDESTPTGPEIMSTRNEMPPLEPASPPSVSSSKGVDEQVNEDQAENLSNPIFSSENSPLSSTDSHKELPTGEIHETPRTIARKLKLAVPKSPVATNFDSYPPPDSAGPPLVSSAAQKEKAQTSASFTPKSLKAKADGKHKLPSAPLSVDYDQVLPANGDSPSKNAPPSIVVAQANDPDTKTMSAKEEQRIKELEENCKKLHMQLQQSEAKIVEIQHEASVSAKKHDDELFIKFQEKEARLLEAAAEDHEQEMMMMRGELEGQLAAVQRQLVSEQDEYHSQQSKMERLLEDTQRRLEESERKAQQMQSRHEQSAKSQVQQMERSLRMAEEKLAQTMAVLDEREEEVGQLKQSVKTLKSSMSEHQEGAQEAEEEMDELHTENETLRSHLEEVEIECASLRAKVEELHGDSEKLSAVKLELRMMQEQHDRERAKNLSAVESTSANSAQLEAYRDALEAEVQDLKRQLAAAHADVEVARADTERVMTGNANLQSALEAFQSEREAELALIEEHKLAAEEVTAVAHAAALEATHEAHEAETRQIQFAADEQIAKTKEEVKRLEEKNERLRLDNVQMRRSLDEAIHRLQATQEDVIDRALMKNVLLDWLTKTGAKERKQVLELMANVLHFSEEEKERVDLDEKAGALGRVVGAVAAPLPPPKADVDHLEGENVREKWVNFLMGETDD